MFYWLFFVSSDIKTNTVKGKYDMERLGTIALSPDILTKSNIGLWAFELDEGSLPRMYVDDAMLKLIGLEKQISPEETYHAWYDHIDPEHYDEVNASVEKMTAGTHAEVQYPWHHPNGEVWIVRCGGVRNYAYTQGIRIEGTHQNVTDVAHFEKKKIEQLQAIVESMSEDYECLLHVDFDNDYEEHYRVSDELSREIPEWVDENSYSNRVKLLADRLVVSEDRELFLKNIAAETVLEKVKDGAPYIVYFRVKISDEVKWMRAKFVHHKAHGDKNCAIIGIANNDESIKMSMRERNVIEALDEDFTFISYINPKTMEEIIYRSDVANATLAPGWEDEMKYEERIKIVADSFVHPEDREYFIKETKLEKLAKDLLKNPTKIINFRIYHNGNTIYYQSKYVLVDIDGVKNVVMGYRNIDRETCEKLAYQEELNAAREKAEAANMAKSNFLFNMSHDIRTPMNAVIGFAGMALSHIDDKEKAVDCLNKVRSSSKHLLDLINDILDMARIESGKVQSELTPACITKEAEELMEMVRETTNKNISVESDFSEIKHNYVLADKLHVNRIIMNIISNSVKYTPEGGYVKYIIREQPSCCDNHYSYDFIVEDNGIGMSEEFLLNIFAAFERENTTTMSGVQGTGLGMAITKNLVDILGGTINIESKQGEGTRTIIHLDMEAVDEKEVVTVRQEEVVVDTSCFEGKRVLLVEDNELNREIATEILGDMNMIVETAENGQQAVEKCKESIEKQKSKAYDIILMDVQMPVMDGYEATRVIRSLTRDSYYRIPIVAMTANAFEEDKRASIEAGMDAHLTKPIEIKDLVNVMKELFPIQ